MLALATFDLFVATVLSKLGYVVTNTGLQRQIDDHAISIQLIGVQGGTPTYPGLDLRFRLRLEGPRHPAPYVSEVVLVLSEADGLHRLPVFLKHLEAGLLGVITRSGLH